jgi:hypothetical protein
VLNTAYTVKGDHKLQAFESEVPRKLSAFMKADISGGFNINHNKEICDLYSIHNFI